MAETPRLDLPYLSASQAQKEIMHNVSLDRLDLLVQCTVLDRNLTAPPASPALGDAYIVGPAPTGAWAGHVNDLALYINLQWQFIAPLPGFQCWVLDEAVQVGWSGSAWTITASGGAGSTTLLGLTDTPDAYGGQAGKTLLVNPGETGMVFGTVAGSAPVDATYIVSSANATLSAERVITDNTQITWNVSTPGQVQAALAVHGITLDKLPQQPPGTLLGRGGSLEVLDDVQIITVGAGLAITGTTLAATGGAGGSSDFLGLTDTPDTYSGQAGKAVVVNAGATALEFGTVASATVTETELVLADVTADNATVALHGFLPKLSGVATEYINGVGAWSTPAGGGGGATTFLALTDSPDSYAGQAGKGVTVNGAATGLEFTTAVTGSYDLGLTWSGTLPASQVLMRYPFPRAVDFPAGLTGSRGVAASAATGTTTLDLRKNGTSVGSVQYAASATTATFTMASATSFAAGDVLTVHAPGTADATLADLGLSLAGTRAVAAGEMGATTFLGLTDTPDVYASNALKILRVNAGATATEFGPVLGTLAQQDASAVAITGGAIRLPVSSTVGGLWIQDVVGTGLYGIRSQVSAGTDKYNLMLDGTAPNHLAGEMGIGVLPTTTRKVRLAYTAGGVQFGLEIQPLSSDTSANAVIFLNAAATQVGSIGTTGSATAFNTSSDVRLKHAIAPLTGAPDVLAALKPVRFKWNADDSSGVGFLAHELQQVVPEAVSGLPDAVNADGSVQPQGVDHSKLVPWLVAALQATMDQVAQLTARVASLEQQLDL